MLVPPGWERAVLVAAVLFVFLLGVQISGQPHWLFYETKSMEKSTVSVVFFGDTHDRHQNTSVQDADILVYTGDCTDPKSEESNLVQIKRFDDWLGTLPHKHKFVVAGNHDPESGVTLSTMQSMFKHAVYLQDSVAEVDITGTSRKIKIYGSPWQPQWPGFETTMLEGPELQKKWDSIPNDIDILATHSPPYGHYDRDPKGIRIGSKSLADAVLRVKPLVHAFGHVHAGRTKEMMKEQSGESIRYINGAICNDDLVAVWSPVIVTLPV